MNDESARFVNDDGKVTTFARLMYKRRGGGDVEKVEDADGGPEAYRVEGDVYRLLNPEFALEARESDRPFAELRRERAAAGEIDDPETIRSP